MTPRKHQRSCKAKSDPYPLHDNCRWLDPRLEVASNFIAVAVADFSERTDLTEVEKARAEIAYRILSDISGDILTRMWPTLYPDKPLKKAEASSDKD